MEIAELKVSMTTSHLKRVTSLTKDTSMALEHTCKGLVELVKYLLAESHSYVYWENLQLTYPFLLHKMEIFVRNAPIHYQRNNVRYSIVSQN